MAKITYAELVEEGAFEKVIANVEKLVTLLGTAEGAIKDAFKPLKSGLSVAPKTVGDVEQVQKLIDRVNHLEEALKKTKETKEKLTIETAKARIEQENYNKSVKELAKDSLGLISEYQKQSKILNEMRNSYKDLILTQKENTKEGRDMLAQITKLDEKLKKVDETVGQHQRHVGNYRGAIKELGKGVSGLAGLMSKLAGALGVNTEHLEQAHNIAKELVKVTKEFTHASKIQHAAAELNTMAVEANTAATEVNTVVTEQTVVAKEAEVVAVQASNAAWLATPLGVFAAIALGIAAVTLAVIEFTKSEEDSAEAIHIFNAAINEQDQNITKLKVSILETGLANDVLTGKMKQETLDKLHNQFDAIKQESDATHKHKEAMANLNKEYARAEQESIKQQGINKINGLVFAGNSVEFLEEERKKKLIIMENKYQTELSLIRTENALKNAEVDNEAAKANRERTAKEQKDGIDYEKILRDLRTQNIRDEYTREWKLILDKYDDERKEFAGQTKILIELQIKRDIALENLKRAHLKAMDDIDKEIEEDKKKDAEKAQKAEDAADIAAINANNEKIKQAEKSSEYFRKKREKEEEEERKRRQEEIKHAIEMAEQLFDVYKDFQDKKAAENIAAIDADLEKNQSAIELQMRLAEEGKANTLAFEMQKQDELEKARMQELERQKKAAKQQEAIELSLAFLKAYETYIGKDMKSGEALVRAFADVSAAKLLGKVLAGSALEGTEDTGAGDGRGLDGKGGSLWMLHPNERVLTKDQNERLGGLSNEQLVNNAMMFEQFMKPNFNSAMAVNDVSKKEQVDSALNNKLIEEVKTLAQVIKNKPESQISWDGFGRAVRKEIQDGNSRTFIKQTFIP